VSGLPDTGPFRVFPTRATQQRLREDAAACARCLGGTCCQSEDAIYLTALDVLRLSAFFDLSPAAFLQVFTQQRFAEGPLEPYRRRTIDDPETSVVTYLRRRSNRSFSPCIFLKYIRDTDGTPRRVCGVYPARPLACRDYYHQHCKTRATGELAALQAHAFELVRDGQIDLAMAESQCERLQPLATREAPMSAWLEYAVWTEVRRALRADEANEEGADSYPIADYQDSLDVKLNRLLSKPRLRLEERYGWIPNAEQLQPFRGGTAFASTPDRRRILRIATTPPTSGLFEDGDYPFFAANRLTVGGMRPPQRFPTLGPGDKERILRALPTGGPFLRHRDAGVRKTTFAELWRATLDAADAVVVFAAYLATLGQVLELEPPGTFEWELLSLTRQLEARRHPILAVHPGLRRVGEWAQAELKPNAAARRLLRAAAAPRRTSPMQMRRLIDAQQPDGTWMRDPRAHFLPETQAEYLRQWLRSTAAGLLSLQPPPLDARAQPPRRRRG